MLNIFNLFLFLLLLWLALMLSADNISWIYLFFGIASAGLISIASFKIKLIDKNSELLYLSFGFYRHFLQLYCNNYFKALKLIITLAINDKAIKPVVYSLNIDHKNKFNPSLMASSFNMSAGLFCISIKEENFFIHAISEKYFKNFDLFKIRKILPKINDDNLV